jgi:hypothetical protein
MGIKENVEAAAMADFQFEEFERMVIRELGVQPDRFWEHMAELCIGKIAKKKTDVYSNLKSEIPMNETAARAFEKEKVPWGEYKGVHVGQVRLDYLTFLAKDNEFTRDVKRYVRSKRFKQRQKEQS